MTAVPKHEKGQCKTGEQDSRVIEPENRTTHKELYGGYSEWCNENGEIALQSISFGKRLQGRGFIFTKPKNVKTWKGIGLV